MRKKTFLIAIIFSLGAGFLFLAGFLVSAQPACDKTLNEFSDGSLSKTVTVPVGGGEVKADVLLPSDSTICLAEMTIDKVSTAAGGTPYIWVPLSGTNQLAQIKTSDGTIIHTFSNNADNCGAVAFLNPSRLTVIPEGDVWVANRAGGSVTRLGKKSGCAGDNCYECKGTYNDIGGGPRGVTFDSSGDIWVGDYSSERVCKYASNGTLINCADSGCKTYGMIGDSSGNVWIADRPNNQLCKCSGNIDCNSVDTLTSVYGIGMDNEDDIWAAAWTNTTTLMWQKDHLTNALTSYPPKDKYENYAAGRGIAADGNNNVWVAVNAKPSDWPNSVSYIYKFDNNGTYLTHTEVGIAAVGVAIDSENNIWVVNYGGGGPSCSGDCTGGSVTKLDNDGTVIATYGFGGINSATSPYNYSDMTGFRTPKISIDIGTPTHGDTYSPTTFPAVVDFTVALRNAVGGCQGGETTGDAICGNDYCKVTIALSSSFMGGEYKLSKLNIKYKEPPSQISGGLVPCGRHCDDLETAMREDVPCTLCHALVLVKRIIDFLTAVVAFPILVLMIMIGGVFWLTAGGSEAKISKGKEIIKTALIAIVILLAAWVIIDTAVMFLTPASAPWQNWSEVTCPVPSL